MALAALHSHYWDGDGTVVPPVTTRRGPHARGHARLYGRRLFWLVLIAGGVPWV